MSAARSKYAWIVICLASIFIYLKTDALPLSSKPSSSSLQPSSQFIDTFYDFDDALEVASVPKRILKRSPDSDDDNNIDDNDGGGSDDSKTASSTTEKPSSSDGSFHNHHHDHGTTRRTVLKQPHPPHNDDHDDNDRNNNSGSGGFNILEFFGTIFRLVWGFFSNIPALLFGTSSSSSSGGQ
ncbi:uncharacterized protein LOC129940393 isoform X3 [Eupeodes corollae]|uniref:uncharacterized protein LOC129940393 isoform X3 n=1 Tax=Eupeodes corollae TaxID=290404 RepID=UPI002491C9A5|nr:uncharacterized protein LOC129940393 isoform X3 [Eupeodes corollae]